MCEGVSVVDVIEIDGSEGEGGGQILRTSLGLSLVTGRPFRLVNVRAGRSTPGLRRQHLASLRAAQAVGNAVITGDEVGSMAVSFAPRGVVAGEHAFVVGTAGSATLVLQTVLPALLRADAPSTIALEGGTDNPMAPSYDFLANSFAPFVSRGGASLDLALGRRGFYPAGGGRFTANVVPTKTFGFEDLTARGDVLGIRAFARVANLPGSIAHRMLHVVRDALRLERDALVADEATDAMGPGVALEIHVALPSHTEVFTVIGEKRTRSEAVAAACIAQACAFIEADVPVGEHLADQLLLLAALAGKGTFVTGAPTRHTMTQRDVIRRFLEIPIRIERDGARHALTVG